MLHLGPVMGPERDPDPRTPRQRQGSRHRCETVGNVGACPRRLRLSGPRVLDAP